MIINIFLKKGDEEMSIINKIGKGKKKFFTSESFLGGFWNSKMPLDTDIIIVDNVVNIEKVNSFFNVDELEVNTICKPLIKIKMPPIVILIIYNK